MPKIIYTATDSSGQVHTRKSERTYTHTVVARRSFDRAMQLADMNWASDRDNFAYFAKIAAGNDPYPARNWLRGDNVHPSWAVTPEKIAAHQVEVDAENAKRLADAIERTAGHTVDSYVAAKRAERVAGILRKRAEGYYDVFVNLGWCGRRDLAEKLVRSQSESFRHHEILTAGRA